MGGGGGWDYDYSEHALKKSSKEYEAQAKEEGVVRSYTGNKASKGLPPPVGKTVSTDSPTPLVVGVDVTGSMGEWPGLIFKKLPVLYNEIKLHWPDVAISFCAIGDANIDQYPLQVCDFKRGKALEAEINSLYPEAGGGGGTKESYELAAYFYARHSQMPRAQRSLFVFCGDEAFYDTLKVNTIKRMVGDPVPSDLESTAIFGELKKKFETYALRVPFVDSERDQLIHERWQSTLGAQYVLRMDDPKRIVDCIIGLGAILAEEDDTFSKRLSLRQTPEQVQQVMKTLHPALARKAGGP